MATMTQQRTTPPTSDGNLSEFDPADWELDVTFVESGAGVDKLIYMTNDGCGKTCQSACTSCPK
ncbi:FxLD family lanthipeptide [Micromonospora sp. SH-82]|uniref:FxLD family lanthipeptide n=1 Tax=Micromonospora sp. SH-82 TaxID=3132938 RepID=UPI003EBC3933